MIDPPVHPAAIGPVRFGQGSLGLIAGPCVAESREGCLAISRTVADICNRLGIGYVFKASFDKANRSNVASHRGPGMDTGLEWLADVREQVGCPVLTDVHETAQCEPVGAVVDALQIPAFLCRQTDLLLAAGRTGKAVNIKKGQFMAPWDMGGAVEKTASTGNANILLTERGTSFGYNRLITDYRGIPQMRAFAPVIFDATHSVQEPGGLGTASGGQREFAPALARAALAVGADGLFLETHPQPDRALSDGPNMIPLDDLEDVLAGCLAVFQAVRS